MLVPEGDRQVKPLVLPCLRQSCSVALDASRLVTGASVSSQWMANDQPSHSLLSRQPGDLGEILGLRSPMDDGQWRGDQAALVRDSHTYTPITHVQRQISHLLQHH